MRINQLIKTFRSLTLLRSFLTTKSVSFVWMALFLSAVRARARVCVWRRSSGLWGDPRRIDQSTSRSWSSVQSVICVCLGCWIISVCLQSSRSSFRLSWGKWTRRESCAK